MQIYKQTDGLIDRQTGRQTDGQTQKDRQIERQTDRQTDKQTDKQTDGQKGLSFHQRGTSSCNCKATYRATRSSIILYCILGSVPPMTKSKS